MSIVVKDLQFTYSANSPYETRALKDINLTINEGDFLGIVGHTGSGKSTFIQHLNGLIRVQEGEVEVFDIKLTNAKKPKPDLQRLRSLVGMVFQYPEYQLFEETVYKDVAFGPKNLGLSTEEIDARVREAIKLVGLDFDKFKDRAPFELSGGQKRRVAIAGIIAMKPKVLILDEPTAGLDPSGKGQILELIKNLKEKCSPTIIVISHDIDEITRFANRLVVFNDGKVAFDEPMKDLFKHQKELVEMGLDIPLAIKIANDLKSKGVTLNDNIVTMSDLLKEIVNVYNKKHGTNIDASNIDKSQFKFDFFKENETKEEVFLDE